MATLPHRSMDIETWDQVMKQAIPHRLMVGHYALNVGIVVRIHVG